MGGRDGGCVKGGGRKYMRACSGQYRHGAWSWVGGDSSKEVGAGVQPVTIPSYEESNQDCPRDSSREGISDGWSGGYQDAYG